MLVSSECCYGGFKYYYGLNGGNISAKKTAFTTKGAELPKEQRR